MILTPLVAVTWGALWAAAGLFGTSFASALIPAINIEAVLAVAGAKGLGSPVLLALIAAVGQMAGKLIWYAAGLNTERVGFLHRRLERPKMQASLDKWRSRAEGRPWYTAALLFLSASVGLPPYAVFAVLAGLLKVPLWIFLSSGLVGRFLRFWVFALTAAEFVSA